MDQRPFHNFTVDVEEHYHASALEAAFPRDLWSGLESRVVGNVDRLLELLDDAGATGTFFVLGIVAEAHPDLVTRIAARGHEVASHGWEHRRVTTLEPNEFRSSVSRSKAVLEDLTGRPVLGYRAPSFSITRRTEWALDILIEEGYRYDSSLFPTRRPGYGHPDAPLTTTVLERGAGTILEVPLTVLRVGGVRFPSGGGAYFRHLPYALTRAALRQRERAGTPGTFYIHPWELDPDQPRAHVPIHTRLRHYGGLGRTGPRLARLLREFRFGPISRSAQLSDPDAAGGGSGTP